MTVVRFAGKPSARSFNNFVDDFFTAMPSIFREEPGVNGRRSVPVNIKETGADYQLEVVAPGLNKDDFRIQLDNHVLTISAAWKSEEKKEHEELIRREYRYQSFSRSFTLNDTIDAEQIVAKYINGVLTLNLPKKAEVKASAKQITVQ